MKSKSSLVGAARYPLKGKQILERIVTVSYPQRHNPVVMLVFDIPFLAFLLVNITQPKRKNAARASHFLRLVLDLRRGVITAQQGWTTCPWMTSVRSGPGTRGVVNGKRSESPIFFGFAFRVGDGWQLAVGAGEPSAWWL